MAIIKPQFIEIIARGDSSEIENAAYETGITDFAIDTFEDKGKVAFQIPTDWNGWVKNRVLEVINEKFDKDAYFGLSLISKDSIAVYDDRGEKADSFVVRGDDEGKTKWIKKKMVIVKEIIDEVDAKRVLVSGWRFDGRYAPPIVNFLDLNLLVTSLPSHFSVDNFVFGRKTR